MKLTQRAALKAMTAASIADTAILLPGAALASTAGGRALTSGMEQASSWPGCRTTTEQEGPW